MSNNPVFYNNNITCLKIPPEYIPEKLTTRKTTKMSTTTLMKKPCEDLPESDIANRTPGKARLTLKAHDVA